MEESKARLDLTDDQVSKLKVIMDDTDARFRQAREHENQEIRQIRDEHMARVRMLLTPEQLPMYEKLHAEREARSKDPEQQRKR